MASSPALLLLPPRLTNMATTGYHKWFEIVENRSTTGDHFYSNFDGLRAVAALMVMVMHFGTIPHVATGAPGVWLFFGLSGFLLYTGFLSIAKLDSRNIVAYLVRRVFRILPLYLAFLIVYVYLFKGWSPEFKLSFFLANGFFVQAKMHLWTIRAELVFYLALPFAFVLLSLFQTAIIRFILLLMMAAAIIFWTLDYYAMFFIGMAAVHGRHWLSDSIAKPLAYLSLLAIILLSTFIDLTEPIRYVFGIAERQFMYQYGLVFFPLCYLVLVGLSNCHSRIFSHPWLRLVGVCGYGIYLWHPLAKEWVQQWTSTHWGFQAGVYIATVVLAVITYVLIEKPGIDMGRRIGHWVKTAPALGPVQPHWICLLVIALFLGTRAGLTDPKIRFQVDVWSPHRGTATLRLNSETLHKAGYTRQYLTKENRWARLPFVFWDQPVQKFYFEPGTGNSEYRIKNFYARFPFDQKKALDLGDFMATKATVAHIENGVLIVRPTSSETSPGLVYTDEKIQPWLTARHYGLIMTLVFAGSFLLISVLLDRFFIWCDRRRRIDNAQNPASG